MCLIRNSVVAQLTPNKSIRIDKCLRHGVETLYRHGIETVACCCGHGRYPTTVICKTKDGRYYELFSGIVLKRKRNFYIRDAEGFYYLPELTSSR